MAFLTVRHQLPAESTQRQTVASPARKKARSGLAVAIALCASTVTLSGCAVFSPIPQSRGSLIEPEDYKPLKPGSSTRSEVLDALGSPTAHATFDDNTWIYISMVTTPTPLTFPSIKKQDVVVLNFDNGGILRTLKTYNRKDALNVGMVKETTPTPGTKINVMQEILGNVGRYNPMSNMSSTFGGSTGPMNSNSGPGHAGSGNSLP